MTRVLVLLSALAACGGGTDGSKTSNPPGASNPAGTSGPPATSTTPGTSTAMLAGSWVLHRTVTQCGSPDWGPVSDVPMKITVGPTAVGVALAAGGVLPATFDGTTLTFQDPSSQGIPAGPSVGYTGTFDVDTDAPTLTGTFAAECVSGTWRATR